MDDVTKKMDASQPVCLPFIDSTEQKVEIVFVPIFCFDFIIFFFFFLFYCHFAVAYSWLRGLIAKCSVYERTATLVTLQIFNFDVLFQQSIDLLLKLIKMYEILSNCLPSIRFKLCAHNFAAFDTINALSRGKLFGSTTSIFRVL